MTQLLTPGAAVVGDLRFKKDSGGRVVRSQSNTVARTDTTAKALFTIPAGSYIRRLSIVGALASNAGTTATLGVGKTTSANELLTGFDVKGATGAGQQVPAGVAAGFGAGGAADQVIYGKYAESGSASSAGGPWTVTVEYHS